MEQILINGLLIDW